MVVRVVPTSRDPQAPRLDLPGFALSTAGVGFIVFAIIEAPSAGWSSTQTIALGAASAALLAVFVAWEQRVAEPMLNLRLFRNPRFSGASLSITVAFFSLAGFIFLIVQYMQVIKGWTPLETGVRTLPVAVAVGVSSVLGTEIAVRRGSKVIVTLGLLCMAAALGWVALAQTVSTSYLVIAGQMLFLGAGMGLTSAPATESIMGSVSIAKAGVGSALNDMSRELGSTLGVAVVGSLFASAYAAELATRAAGTLPSAALAHAKESVGAAYETVHSLTAGGAGQSALELKHVASIGFINGLSTGCFVVAGICIAGAVVCAVVLPAQPTEIPDESLESHRTAPAVAELAGGPARA